MGILIAFENTASSMRVTRMGVRENEKELQLGFGP